VWIVSDNGFERELDDEGSGVAAVTLAGGLDATLQTPALELTGPLSFTFKHRHGFDADFSSDGGVIEISTDGTNFVDIADLGVTPMYTGVIQDFGLGQPLANRSAHTGKNPSFPAYDTETITFGPELTGTVFLRFRGGGAFFASRWEIDSVAFSGISNTPFPSAIAEPSECVIVPEPEPGEEDDGGGCCGASSDPRGALLLVGLIALLDRRRRVPKRR
jgi:hypothetical protein